MIGWVIFMVVEKLKSAATEWVTGWATERLGEEGTLVKEVETELDNMQSKMQYIQTVLEDAENQSVKDRIVKLWLDELQDLSYDMEDVLDEWNTRIQILEREEVEKKNIVRSSSSSEAEENTSNEIAGSSSWLPFKQLKQVPWRRDIAFRIRDINQRINELFKEMKQFQMVTKAVTTDDLSKINNYNDTFRTTTSSVDESKVYGRDQDKDFLLSKVLSVNTEKEKSLQVVSIVGVGGLGKTTLAQLVYNDEKVKKEFGEKRIWVCVSKPFNEVKVAQDILEGLPGHHTKMDNLQALHQAIAEELNEDKGKFLLVLDDVWEEEPEKWEKLSRCLKVGDPNSRILVTTRKEKVVRTMGTTPSNILKPRLISDSDCWLLMKQRALQGRPDRENDELEEIGNEIAKKCNGLPLAAKTLGGLLISKDSIQEWKDVLKSEIWELVKAIDLFPENQIDLFPHIFLSYQELPSVLKRCFLILALFPKDTYLTHEQIMYHWMTYGFLNPKIAQGDMVKTGKKYLKFLVSRAFLEQGEDEDEECKKIIVVSMHDIMHDFALYLLGDELLSITVVDDDTESGSTSESTSKRRRKSTKARHLIINGNINQTPIGFDLEKLHTCILLKVPPNVTSDLVKDLKMVRKLNLQHCELKQVPEGIGNLIHLRMLVLSDNPLVELPATIGNLFNLQHLFLERISSLSSFPLSFRKLVNLISLTPYSLALEKAPKSVEKLINLHRLGRLQIEAGKSYLGLLKDLNQLRDLEIWFDSYYDDEVDAKKAAIGSKKYLTRFELRSSPHEATNGVVAALKPHPNIQTLETYGLLPSWVTFLPNLKDLRLHSPGEISTLPPFGKLQFLEKLLIDSNLSLKTIGREFLGIESSPNKKFCAFPKLVELTFISCRYLRGFEDLKAEEEGEITVMPNLQILKFQRCDGLVEIPFRLVRQASSLKKLYIRQQRLNSKSQIDLDVEVIDEGVAGDVRLYHWLDHIVADYGTLKMRVKSSKKVPIIAIAHIYFTFFQLWSPATLSSIWSLPPMGKLPYLESLTIDRFRSLQFIWREFLGIDDEEFVAFPQLGEKFKSLEFIGTEFLGIDNEEIVVFPNLESLEISRCDLLEGWEDLKEEDEGKITVLPKLEKLKITKCPKFQVMPPRLLSQLSSLKVLHLPHDD